MKSELKVSAILRLAIASAFLTTASVSQAAVKFRVDFDTANNAYSVYMTPATTPEPDMLLSSQVTLVVPHSNTGFSVDNIQSHVAGTEWRVHSRVNAPDENPGADYISFGYNFSGTKPPSFDWVPGQEKAIFSFNSRSGCSEQVRLIDNKDALSQLPNSVQTNPGNDFLNLGWQMSNAYIGNYGSPIRCEQPVVVEQPACEHQTQDDYLLSKIDRLEALKANAPAYLQVRFNTAIDNLESQLQCPDNAG
ncbi:MAG: cadherin [Thiolinea sp.]